MTRINWFMVASTAIYLFLIGLVLALCGLAISGIPGCTVQPQVTVSEVNITMCIALVETKQGIEEELVYCDAGEGINLTEAGVIP